MRKPAAIKIALLALMLAVSHIALVSHVTAHFEPELEQCELCVSHAQWLSAIPVSDHGPVLDIKAACAGFENREVPVPPRRCLTVHQRAPPLKSA